MLQRKANGDWGNYRVDKLDGVDKIGWSPTNKLPADDSEKGEIEPEWEEKALSGRKTLLCQETKFLFNVSSSAGKKAPKPDVTRQVWKIRH